MNWTIWTTFYFGGLGRTEMKYIREIWSISCRFRSAGVAWYARHIFFCFSISLLTPYFAKLLYCSSSSTYYTLTLLAMWRTSMTLSAWIPNNANGYKFNIMSRLYRQYWNGYFWSIPFTMWLRFLSTDIWNASWASHLIVVYAFF